MPDESHLSWWRSPFRWHQLSAEERLTVREARFIRLRSRQDPFRFRRPGEFSIPGLKFSLAVGVVVGTGLWLVGGGSLWRNVVGVAVATFLVSLVIVLVAGLFLKPAPPPMEPPFGNSGDRVPR